nr:Ig-like domain-containing protein [Rhodopirellula sallentina]
MSPATSEILIDPAAYGVLRSGQSETIVFDFSITDGLAAVTNQLTVTISGRNDAPIALDDVFTVEGAGPHQLAVLDNDVDVDGDSLSIVSVSAISALGTVEIGLDGSMIYNPAAGYVGVETFSYTVSDGQETVTAEVSISVDNNTVDTIAPTVDRIYRSEPINALTDSDSLKFRVFFNEQVSGIDANDFVVLGTTAEITDIELVGENDYDITVAGGDLAALNARVGLSISETAEIEDLSGNPLLVPVIVVDSETFEVRNGQQHHFVTSVVSVPADAANPSSTTAAITAYAVHAGLLMAWIDFDADGQYQDDEKIFDSIALSAGLNLLTFDVPAGATIGMTDAVFRWASTYEDEVWLNGSEELTVMISSVDSGSVQVSLRQPGVIGWTTHDKQFEVLVDEQVVYRSPVESIVRVGLTGSDGDDQFRWPGELAGLDGVIDIDGGKGFDSLSLQNPETGLDLTSEFLWSVQAIDAIRLDDNVPNTISMTAEDIRDLPSHSSESLRVYLDPDDHLDFRSHLYRTSNTFALDGRLATRIGELSADVFPFFAPFDVLGKNWTNPLEPTDVNGSGDITALDALVIINELNRKQFVVGDSTTLVDPNVAPAAFPGFYYDVTQDGEVTALDALRVINRLNAGFRQEPMATGGGLPGTSVTISRAEFDPDRETTVTFRDSDGYRVTVNASSVTATSVTAPIPIWMDFDTLEFRTATVEVIVTQTDASGKQTKVFAENAITIDDLPQPDLPVGVLTRTYFSSLVSVSSQAIFDLREIATASENTVNVNSVVAEIQQVTASYQTIIDGVNSLLAGTIDRLELGSIQTAGGPIDLFLDIEGLAQFDRVVATWVTPNVESNEIQTLETFSAFQLAPIQIQQNSSSAEQSLDDLDEVERMFGPSANANVAEFRTKMEILRDITPLAASAVAIGVFVVAPSLLTGVTVAAISALSLYYLSGVSLAGTSAIQAMEGSNALLTRGDATQSTFEESTKFAEESSNTIAREMILQGVLAGLPSRIATNGAAAKAANDLLSQGSAVRDAIGTLDGDQPSIAKQIIDSFETIRENLDNSNTGISVDVSSLSFDVPKGGEATMTDKIVITNQGDEPVNVSLSNASSDYTVSPASGSIAAGGSLEVTVTLQQSTFNRQLQDSPQTFDSEILVKDAEGETIETVAVDVVVTAGDVTPSAEILEIIVPPGGVGATTFSLSNTGPIGSISNYELTTNTASNVNIVPVSGSNNRLPTNDPAEFNIEVRNIDPENLPTDLKLIVRQTDFDPAKETPVQIRVIMQQNVGITIDAEPDLRTSEDDSSAEHTATFTVRLDSRPTSDVTIQIMSSDDTEGRLEKSSLIFTPENWNVDQRVTVLGVDDDTVDGDIQYQIDFEVRSEDASYNALELEHVQLANVDNDITPPRLDATVQSVPNVVIVGQTFSFQVTVTNNGTTDITPTSDYFLKINSMELGSGFIRFDTPQYESCSLEGPNVFCSFDSLHAGQSTIFDFQATGLTESSRDYRWIVSLHKRSDPQFRGSIVNPGTQVTIVE